jgi:hypothetical protein
MAQSIVPIPLWSWGRARRYLLATTALTTVLQVAVPGTNSDWVINGSIQVAGSSTQVLLQYLWTDPDGGPQTLVVVNSTLAPNVYPIDPVPILAQAGTVVVVQAQVGTANTTRITTSIWGG